MNARKRLMSEINDYNRQPKDQGITIIPNEHNIFRWTAVIEGPKDTPYQGGKFTIMMDIPSDYPMEPPTAKFITKVFHPNVHTKTGEICLDILKRNWTPAWTILAVCQAILVLLMEPAPDSPLNCDAGNMLRYGDERGYNSMARMYTKEYARK
eukprot:TRINITY_DN10195_c0_g1_i2.p1 TRINITY_DN10195_c0_g1~~TRINITY_DN10195_c0_g1_i2.p1  ORF type:complete len:180 (+),score=11.32 TRINITY_DN10195_c0_g1_i2:82-540(+)